MSLCSARGPGLSWYDESVSLEENKGSSSASILRGEYGPLQSAVTGPEGRVDMAEGPPDRRSVRAKVAPVTENEAAYVAELFTLAFRDDPTWSWAFPDPARRLEQLRMWWELYLHSALPYGWVWMTDDGSAAALWIPPDEPELSEPDEERMEPLLRQLVGPHAEDVLTLLGRFEANHPRETPHYYLSLLATHPLHRGQGKGMGLLSANLAQIDEQGYPVYLESSNRTNDVRYKRLGFVEVGEFAAPGDGPTVACMWRDPR
jgi:GNAT superfamily N-acetyltransferase